MTIVQRSILLVSMVMLISSATASPTTDCTNKPADVVFVLDTSTSIWPLDFKKQTAFVSDIVKKFDIGPGPTQTRVGVLTFGHAVWRQFDLKTHMDKNDLIAAVDSIKHGRGLRTNTGDAIRFATNKMFTRAAGSRPGVSRVAIVITDGRSQRPWQTKAFAQMAHDAGIIMFAIGIGRNLDFQELSAIASDPDKEFMFSVGDFNALTSITDRLAHKTCEVTVMPESTTTTTPATTTTPEPTTTTTSSTTTTTTATTTTQTPTEAPSNIGVANDSHADQPKETCGGKPADVFFVLDASSSIIPKDFNKEIDFVKSVVNIFDVSSGKTRVGAMSFSQGTYVHIDLDNNLDKDTLLEQISDIKQTGGGTNTAEALRKVRLNGFTKSARPDVPKIAIILTDGLSADSKQTARQAKLAHMTGITVFAIGIGTGVDFTEIRTIASDPDDNYVFQVDDFSSLDMIKGALAIKTCGVKPAETKQNDGGKPACEVKKNTELMFVYDSNAMGSRRTHAVSQFIAKIVSKFDLQAGFLQVGRLTDNCPSGGNFALSSQLSSADFSEIIMPSLSTLIRRARRSGFSADYGARSDSTNVAVVFIDSEMVGVDHTVLRETLAMSRTAEVYAVVVGKGPMINRFTRNIKTSNLIHVDSYKHLELAEEKLVNKLCYFFFADYQDYDIDYVVPV